MIMRYWLLCVFAFWAQGCAIDMNALIPNLGDKLFEGEDCSVSEEPWDACIIGLACSPETGKCVQITQNGPFPEGQPCAANGQCAMGLVCANDATCEQEGAAGTVAAGDSCEVTTDCQSMLSCSKDGVCEGFQAFWTGAECSDPPAAGEEDIKVYFEVPGYDTGREGRAPEEFYRLPFPNDIRLKDGHIDLSGHPDPGVVVEELGDPVRDYFDMVEQDLDGFGTQSAVFFQLNYYPANDSMKLNETMYLLDIDPDSPDFGKTHGVGFSAASGRGMYICYNWIALLLPGGNLLSPNTTYAAILTTGITDKEGKSLTPDADFSAMLDDAEPDDATLAAAWSAYQPLRDYLKNTEAETQFEDGTIAAAAVFTTADPTKNIRAMRESVRAQDSPEAKDVNVDDSDALFFLETGTVSVPFYQQGTRPFLKPVDGGGIEYGKNGLPKVVETEDVKYALSIPEGDVPEGGFPVFIYAHGTGGSEMSFVDDDIAARLSTLGAAVIGLEQVQHGRRRGLTAEQEADDTYSPENLFYNFLNPRAARDNNMQAAADLFQTIRFIEQRAQAEGILNAERIYFFGHSQGTQGSFIGATYEPLVKGFILSGAGGFLIESLLGKKQPVDATTAIKLALMDPDVSRTHPVLNIVQAGFDSVDPTNFASAVFWKDLTADGINPRSVFMSSGVGDNYTPENTQAALAHAMLLLQWVTSGEALQSVALIENGLPFQGGNFTGVLVRFAPPEGVDGHFVMFENEDARLQADYFIETMLDPLLPSPILEDAANLR
jgi:pimeloyl-ACP methyl ester carboxylesterase